MVNRSFPIWQRLFIWVCNILKHYAYELIKQGEFYGD